MELHITPNDAYLSSQWYLNTIHAYDAWNVTLGSPNITVAVIDYGIWWNHEDLGLGNNLYQNVWLNPNEDTWNNVNSPTTGNHIDDDSNGYIDDWKGWNFVSSNNDTRANHYHGTMVSGIIAAKTNNGMGIAGIAGGNSTGGVKIMGINIGYTDEYGNECVDGSLVDDAIIYAVNNGAKVINMSFGSIDSQTAIQEAINYAVDKGVILVASSGNEDYSGNTNIRYPAKYTNVIAVGATDMSNAQASFSFYGTELDCVAPGVQIYSTSTNSYEIASTSGNPYLSYTSDDRYIYLTIHTPNIYGIRQFIWNATPIGSGGSSQSSTTGPAGDYWSIPKGSYNVECRIVTQCAHLIATTTVGGYRSAVYPNPVDNTLHIDIVEPQETENAATISTQQKVLSSSHELRLFNFQGNLVRNLRVTDRQVSIDVSGLPEGNYFLHIIRAGSTEPEVHKVIISH